VNGLGTLGFGVPNEVDPHHFTVEIPAGRDKAVTVTEHFGLRGGSNGTLDSIERCVLARSTWSAIGEDIKRVLNARLKEKGLPTSRWSTGINRTERLLGRELCVLAWAVESAQKDQIANAVRNWTALRPEERWWLFSMAASISGTAVDGDVGWRKAIRIALTETPSGEAAAVIRAKQPRSRLDHDTPQIHLFHDSVK
jgi:hypothetical protein